MDVIRTLYKQLFTVEFIHDGFKAPTLIDEAIRIKSDTKTKNLFNNYCMSYIFFYNTLLCFIRCQPLDPVVPYTLFPGEVHIRFLLTGTSKFFDRTEIKFMGAKQVYYFNNRKNAGPNRFITQSAEIVTDGDLEDIFRIKPEDSCFGVIDIYSSNAKDNSYELFSGSDQQLKNPAYKIKFKNKV